MKKNGFWAKALMGVPIGITIGYLITVVGSAIAAPDNVYSPVVPAFAEAMGGQIQAVGLQTLLCAVMGFTFGGMRVVFDKDDWSMLKQTLVYFLVTGTVAIVSAYVCCWMEHTVWGVVRYLLIFIAVFLVVWFILYSLARRDAGELNAGLKNKNQG